MLKEGNGFSESGGTGYMESGFHIQYCSQPCVISEALLPHLEIRASHLFPWEHCEDMTAQLILALETW